MRHPAEAHPPSERLTSYFWSGELLRSRSVAGQVLCGVVDVPAPPARLVADWDREVVAQLALQPGDVEPLSLPRARMRWPDYRRCVQAAADWTRGLGLQGLLGDSDVALMACRGAKYHHDGAQYGAAAFCNLFLSEDKGLDVHFPATGQRIALVRGTVLLFDTGQPHAVIRRGSSGFDAADFASVQDCSQVFLTWELPIENPLLARALQIDFDTDAAGTAQRTDEQIWRNGAPARLCPDSGRWLP